MAPKPASTNGLWAVWINNRQFSNSFPSAGGSQKLKHHICRAVVTLGMSDKTHPSHIFVLVNSLTFFVENPGTEMYIPMWKIQLLPVSAEENKIFYIQVCSWHLFEHSGLIAMISGDHGETHCGWGFPKGHKLSVFLCPTYNSLSCSSENAPAQFGNGIFNFFVLIKESMNPSYAFVNL